MVHALVHALAMQTPIELIAATQESLRGIALALFLGLSSSVDRRGVPIH